MLSRIAAWVAPSTHARELRPLDAVRGVAAFLVFVFHMENPTRYAYFSDASVLGESLRSFVRHGYLWVDMFLVLSGFILASKYHGLQVGKGFAWRAYIDFIVKRFARVYPLYITVTLVVLALQPADTGPHWWPDRFDPPLGIVLPNVLLVQAWGLAPSVVAPGWSLSAEYAVYLAFPIVTMLLLARGRAAAVAASVSVMAVVGFLWWTTRLQDSPYDVHDFFESRTLLRAFSGFGLGVLAWRVDAARVLHALSPGPRSAATAASILLVALTMARDGQELLTLPAFAFLLVGLSAGGPLTQRILNAPIFFTLGYLSYSVYLIHDELHSLHDLLERTGGRFLADKPAHLLALGLTLAAGYTLAALAYRFVEEPARRAVLRRWRGRQAQGKTPPRHRQTVLDRAVGAPTEP